ncbi:hypothetical protein B4U84_29000 [Westiellopsis prolifica IICB1]|nr:hypothetical protein B4U84_29925 [Westiellopsis prolifica IICB1]TBR56586.1 hypothetical protein B4U84_29000 [Westiellopsis prolifica IICB1]
MKTQTTLEYLVKQLVIKFAEINGYEIQPYMDILKMEDPRIKVWLEMAEVAYDYLNENLF